MKRIPFPSAALATVAALTMAATPAMANDLSRPAADHGLSAGPAAWSDAAVAANQSRWGHRHRHHRDGIDAGDVLAGVLILGGIAAVASAVDNDRKEPRVEYRDPEPRYQGGGMDGAADMCVAEIERDVRVGSVDGIDRDAGGWRVSGSLYDGGGFTCRIGNDGRISDIELGRGYDGDVRYDGAASDRQWSDDAYAAAWSGVDAGPAPQQPAYPGGPLPGEDYDN